MQNISLNNQPIELRCGAKYIIIDAVYIDDIVQKISNLNASMLTDEIRNKVFPYTDTPFAEYIPIVETFSLSQIKKVDYNEIKQGEKSVFSSDSGVLIFVNERLFLDFIQKFRYSDLVDSKDEILNIDYWRFLVKNYILTDIAIVVPKGIDSGIEFDGSGSYKVY